MTLSKSQKRKNIAGNFKEYFKQRKRNQFQNKRVNYVIFISILDYNIQINSYKNKENCELKITILEMCDVRQPDGKPQETTAVKNF